MGSRSYVFAFVTEPPTLILDGFTAGLGMWVTIPEIFKGNIISTKLVQMTFVSGISSASPHSSASLTGKWDHLKAEIVSAVPIIFFEVNKVRPRCRVSVGCCARNFVATHVTIFAQLRTHSRILRTFLGTSVWRMRRNRTVLVFLWVENWSLDGIFVEKF